MYLICIFEWGQIKVATWNKSRKYFNECHIFRFSRWGIYRSRDRIMDHRGCVVAVTLWMQHSKASTPGLMGLPLPVQHQSVVKIQILGGYQAPHLRQHGQLERRRNEKKTGIRACMRAKSRTLQRSQYAVLKLLCAGFVFVSIWLQHLSNYFNPTHCDFGWIIPTQYN